MSTVPVLKLSCFPEIALYLTLPDILNCRTVSKLFRTYVSGIQKICIAGEEVRHLKSVVNICQNLKIVTIQRREVLHPEFFAMIELSDLQVSRLCFENIHTISDEWCSDHGLIFPKVLNLSLVQIGSFAYVALQHFLLSFPSLRVLRLYDCTAVSSDLVSLVLQSVPSLAELYIEGSCTLQHVRIPSVAMMSLKHVSINRCPVLSSVQLASSIISCSLRGTAMTDDVIHSLLCDCGSLIHLDLSYCHYIRELNISSSCLVTLKAEGCSSLISVVADCPLLEVIHVRGCWKLLELSVTSKHIVSIDLTMLQSLCYLDLCCTNLVTLRISGCMNLKYFGRANLLEGECKKLITLDILRSNCPSLLMNNGSSFAGSPLYDKYVLELEQLTTPYLK